MKSVTIAAAEAQFARQKKVRFLRRPGSEFTGFEPAQARQWVSP